MQQSKETILTTEVRVSLRNETLCLEKYLDESLWMGHVKASKQIKLRKIDEHEISAERKGNRGPK